MSIVNCQSLIVNCQLEKWWAKMDSLFCGKATPVATVHRTVAKSRLSSPFWRSRLPDSLVQVLTPFFTFFEVVGQNGLEPSTSRLSVVCSSQLSYWPISRRNQIHNVRFQAPLKASSCVFVSPLPIKPASLGFYGIPFGLTSSLGTYFSCTL